jgi:hypothetical protein
MTALSDASGGGKDKSETLGDKEKQIKVVLYAGSLAEFEAAILKTGKHNRGEAIIEICRFYLGAHGGQATKGQFDPELESILAAQSIT